VLSKEVNKTPASDPVEKRKSKKMKIDLMQTHPKNSSFPLYDEGQTKIIGRLVPDHNGYLKVENDAQDEEISKAGGGFEQFDDADEEEKFCVSY
jgi:hypothetical protein